MENIENKENKNNKKKSIIIVIVAVLVAACVAAAVFFGGKHGGGDTTTAGETEIVAVTDENGEPVTDENGNPVTEVVAVTDGESASAGQSTTSGDSGTTAQGGSGTATTAAETTKKVIAKPETPKAVTGLKLKKATEDTLELTWDKVNCDGYQICYSTDRSTWDYYPKQKDMGSFYTSNGIKLTNLQPYTRYYIYVRAYNMNEAGTSASAWSADFYADTLEMKSERNITFTVKLPANSNQKDTLELWIDNELAESAEVNLNGTEVTFTTKKKYKGVVVAWAGLKGENISAQKKVGGESVYLDLSATGIDQQYDDVDL